MKEQWKVIKGNGEIYEVSNLGNVRRRDREGARGHHVKGHILTQLRNGGGIKTGELARKFNVNPQTITEIVSERIWRSIL